MVVSDSIAATPEVSKCSKIRRISIATLIGEAMRRISHEESVSSLFD
jgi:ribose-phosphate pyrophosphokinase